MGALDYIVELKVDCSDNDINDNAFIRPITMIGGHDVVEEFLACEMYPLSASFGFRNVVAGVTVVSRVETPLPIFPMETILVEGASHFLEMMETNAEKVLGSYGPREHDACMVMKLSNDGHLNRVFEQMGIPYGPRPLPGTDAFVAATKNRKANVSKKTVMKKAKVVLVKAVPVKVAPSNKLSVVKVI
jgi:hypothetical protein